jgi:biopolymer transport protein ExbD
MPGDCSKSWQTCGSGGSIGLLWHSTYLEERLVLLLLAVMLARIVVVGVRISCLLARRAKSSDTTSHTRTELAAEMCVKLRSLESVFSTAPYLGLLGTTLGMLDRLSMGSYGNHPVTVWDIVLGIAAAFLSTAAGILVAVPATCLHNYFCVWADSLEIGLAGSCRNKARFPLRPRLSTFAFPLTATPVLALAIGAFMIFPPFSPSMGLRVHLRAIDVSGTKAPTLEPIIITIVNPKADAVPTVFVNSEKTPWDELQNKLQSELEGRPLHSVVSVQGDKDIAWQHVVYVTDVVTRLHADVVLLTIKSKIRRPRRLPR